MARCHNIKNLSRLMKFECKPAGDKRNFVFKYKPDNHRQYALGYYFPRRSIFFYIEYYRHLPKEFGKNERSKFAVRRRFINGRYERVYVFKQGVISRREVEKLHFTPDHIRRFYIAQPRNYYRTIYKPKYMSVDKAVELIRGKRILFYTGAGISVAARIPDVKLAAGLTIDFDRPFHNRLLALVVRNPTKLVFSLCEFFISLNKRQPTPAHIALTDMALQLDAKILTHNLDDLHEKTGLSPSYVSSRWLKNTFTKAYLETTDIVCAIGLKRDTIGLLQWFKQNNAHGVVIAINRVQPRYLGRNDVFLKGDIQDVVVKLSHIMLEEDLCLGYSSV